ncbi:hypothetical protein EX895_003455 [Sporisorium graminicola]|uniref:Zn(2)-C6 fungal-type domain-containing protein n=1 Tax=Sporisorium graminicola TaxID=280036 RepID=A0A4U7KTI8_9BASI|nr:hypothetical protein EX895_003455 [Sporisorium graminicola]TKY87874.1 hypothetical protein EX895_003455 [Sporisorium graminicola]
MVLAVAAPHKRRHHDAFASAPHDPDHDIDDNMSPSPSQSPPPGAIPIAGMIASRHQSHHRNQHLHHPQLDPSNDTFDHVPFHDASNASNASSSTKHCCDICSKTFARYEHMLRHRASHTNAAPFACSDCGKRFRRSDVLQRHRKLHLIRKERSLDESNAKLTKRQRSALHRVDAACLRCSSKKLKCDAKKPCCSRCLRMPDVQCTYPSNSHQSPSPSSSSRTRSASIAIDNVQQADAEANNDNDEDENNVSVGNDAPPVASLTPYLEQPQVSSPASLSATASFVASAEPSLANMALPLNLDRNRKEIHFQEPHFSSTVPASLLPLASPITTESNPPVPFHQTHSLHTSATSSHLVAATPTSANAMHTSAPPLNSTAVYEDRSMTDLLEWLDGAKRTISNTESGQIDWIFADSPEAPPLLDWNQMHQWANFDLAACADDSLLAGTAPSSSSLVSRQQQPQHASLNEALEQQPNLLSMLSSAAEMMDNVQRTPQSSLPPHVGSRNAGATPVAGASMSTAASPRTATPNHALGAVAGTNRPPARGRSRWNSPELADDELAALDHAKFDPVEAKRDLEITKDDDGLRPASQATGSRHLRASAVQAWPNRWNPALKENQLPEFTFSNASEEHLMSEDMAHVKRVNRTAMTRMAEHLKNAAQSPIELERFEAAFSTLDASTLNVYLQLFFHHCYTYLPAIHQATFDPDQCDPRLLAALCAVGAFFSEVPGSRNAAVYLASLTQMSVSRATLSNNAMARVTSTFQSILLIYMIWRSVGVPARQEYAEAFRSTYCTMVRRCRLLENISPPKLAADVSLDERWMAWVAWETGRRTAWATLVSETELSLHWNLPEPFAPNELTGKLPCDDQLWQAPSAIEWAQTAKMLSPIHRRGVDLDHQLMPVHAEEQAHADFVWPDSSEYLDVHQACDIIQRTAQSRPEGHSSSVTDQERESLVRLSPFSRLCVGSALMLSTHQAVKMVRFCTMLLGDEEQALERMRAYLSAATDLLDTKQPRDARVALLLHAIQLFALVSPETLQVLSCRRGAQRMHAARLELSTELNETKPWKTASIVFHAGQMLRHAKQSLERAPVECLHIFYAAVALHSVSLVVLQQDRHASPGQIVRISFYSSAASSARAARPAGPWRKCSSASSMASSTSPSSSHGGNSLMDTGFAQADGRAEHRTTYMLESVGNLAHSMAPARVLSLASRWLQARDGAGVWPIGQSLAKILDSLATLPLR